MTLRQEKSSPASAPLSPGGLANETQPFLRVASTDWRPPGVDNTAERDVVGDNRGKDTDALLADIARMLEDGLVTKTEPFPETQKEFGEILDELRQLAPDDIKGRLVISGYVNRPFGPDKQRCQECMYYLVHRKWCDIPEISLPAEPDWWCRLWRI